MTDIGRNDPCHCGSGKKYKKCHLEKDEVSNRKEREKAALNAQKVMAAETKDAEKEDKDKEEKHPGAPSSRPNQPGWMQKMAGRVGFFRGATQRRAPPSNKNG